MTAPVTVTVTGTGYTITAYGHTFGVQSSATTHVVVYPAGGWNPATKASDLPCITRHRSEAAATKAARDAIAGPGGVVVALDA